MSDQLELRLLPPAPAEETLAALRRLLPGAFVEGAIDRDRLLAALGLPAADEGAERYGFSWSGRSEAARALASRPTGALVPQRDVSLRFDDARHVVIEGDNLEVLKLLLPAYRGQVKLIFIDPPYNTGHDFIYEDDFRDGTRAYLERTGQLDAEGRRLSSKAEVDGRHHSRWLTMMWPRLALARQLLREDGAIFVAADHHENHHLRLLLDEVFGEENFVAQVVWQKRYTRSNNTDRFTSVIDHLLLYQRSSAFQVNLLPRSERDLVEFSNPDDDARGPWKPTSFLNQVPPERRPNLAYPLTNPNTGEVTVPTRKAWRVGRPTFERLQREGRLWWGADGRRPVPQVKTYLAEIRQGLTPTNFWGHAYAGHTDKAHAELKELFGRKVFDTPKPSRLIRRALEHATGPDDLVLDFFAGSGSTAQAVLELNRDDGGSRRCILVQLPELVFEGGFDTIADITRARVRRVAERLAEADPEATPAGFRAFRLAESALPVWPTDPPPADAAALEAAVEAAAAGAAPDVEAEHLVFELAARAGFALTATVERVELAGQPAWSVEGGALVACLDAPLDDDRLTALAERPGLAVLALRDAAFAGDDARRLRLARALAARDVRLVTV